jgi:ubiquinone/menaquinone biosynthesis C-methylase UbiE
MGFDFPVDRGRPGSCSAGRPRGRLPAGHSEALPFPGAAFELAFCCEVLEHVDERGRVAEISRVLQPDGIFF